MFKGLLRRLFKRNDDVDLGAVSFMINLKEGVDKQDAEEALIMRGIKPYNYLTLSRIFFCTVQKSVYENVFNTKLYRGDPRETFGNTPEGYVEKGTPCVPHDLSTMVEHVVLNTVCIGTPESIEEYHKNKRRSFLDYLRRK